MMKRWIFALISAMMMIFLTMSISAAQAAPDSATRDTAIPISAATDAERAQRRKNLKSNNMIENDFFDNEIILFLYETENPEDYTLDTFAAYGVVGMKRSEYHAYHFLLTLDRHDKQNVLDVCDALYDIPGVFIAEPNGIAKPDNVSGTTPAQPESGETVNTAEATKDAAPDTVQAFKTNGTGTITKGGGAVATGDSHTGYAMIALLFILLSGFAVLRLYRAK